MKQPAVRVGLVTLLSFAAFGQSPEKLPSFEVADVQVSKDTTPRKESFLPSGRVDVPAITLRHLVMAAYGVQENMIVGGPKWLDSDHFDIVAKAPPSTPLPTLLLMLRSLLAESFKLEIHREQKAMPAYALVRGKRPLRLQPAADPKSRQTCNWQDAGPGRLQRICHNLTMAELARQLPGWGPARVDLPVADLSELKGGYDFQLEMSPPGKGKGEGAGGGKTAAPDLAEITIFDALEQIGLRLESRKLPLQVIVIDHAEKVAAGN